MSKSTSPQKAIILGSGPAGLACALELSKSGVSVTVLERESQVGGLCRTIERSGNYFDIGGHRFFSKNKEVNELWTDILGEDLLRVSRKSRIFYRKRFYDYPLRLLNVLANLGLWNSFLCFLSYLRSALVKPGDEATFEGWVINRFGKRLYEIFFKTYTEKVWNIPCSELSSDWATQRIRGMSMKRAILDAIGHSQEKKTKSFIKTFIYPIYGPGLFCEKLRSFTENFGARYALKEEIISVRHANSSVAQILSHTKEGRISYWEADQYFSSIPLTVLLERLDPKPPYEVLAGSQQLKYRSFVVVNIVLDQKFIFDDHWVYVHNPEVKLARIQNYKNWSHFMVKDSSKTTLGLEYFVTEGDEFWNMPNDDIVSLALAELESLKISSRKYLIESFVIKVPKVYPVYDEKYKEHLNVIRQYLDQFRNLTVMGRCGMFRYDNSDHALLTGLYAARNMHGARHDLWDINTDPEYHEELGPYNKDLIKE